MNQLSEWIKGILSWLAGQTPGLLIGAFTLSLPLFLTGFKDEFFQERSRKAKHRRDVARLVLKICNEASTCSFRRAPRDMEHINSVLTDVEGIDKDRSVVMEKFVSAWQTYARERSKGQLSPDDVKFAKEEIDRAEENRKVLVEWSNRIRTGKYKVFL